MGLTDQIKSLNAHDLALLFLLYLFEQKEIEIIVVILKFELT